ncbi:hypothetical protein F4558_005942 [Micromonospora profundi]|nr:hypothetical protein [Micromonospora profundi]
MTDPHPVPRARPLDAGAAATGHVLDACGV